MRSLTAPRIRCLQPRYRSGSLHRNVSEQELNLFQFTSCRVAKLGARAPQVVGGKTGKACSCGIQFHHVPDDAFRDAIAPPFTSSADATEHPSGVKVSCVDPFVHRRFDPVGNGNRSNVAALANEIDYGPVLFPLLQMCEL